MLFSVHYLKNYSDSSEDVHQKSFAQAIKFNLNFKNLENIIWHIINILIVF